MIRNTIRGLNAAKSCAFSFRRFSSLPTTDEWFIYPREEEGNNYSVNWSLAEDGVVPVGDAFRNARLSVLTKRLGVKNLSTSDLVETSKPLYYGDFKVLEAGDSISHDDFNELFSAQQEHLSSGCDLFVEDGSIGSFSPTRLGVRIVTDDPATALVFRTLLIPTPPRPVDHRARFDGWNRDPRWKDSSVSWTGDQFSISDVSSGSPQPGQRPITAFVGGGGGGSNVAIQFVQNSEQQLVGANVVSGSAAPVMATLHALAKAATVLSNDKFPSWLALSSLSLSKGDKTVVVVDADEDMVAAAASEGVLLGAYANLLSSEGVSPLFHGFVGSSSTKTKTTTLGFRGVPVVSVNGKAAIATVPANLSFCASHLCFFDAKHSSSSPTSLSEEEAVKRLVDVTDDGKIETIRNLIKGRKVLLVGKGCKPSSLLL